MMKDPALSCREDPRRDDVRAKQGRYGLDYVEVSNDQLTLHVVFLGKGPATLRAGNFRVDGGQRIRGIQVTAVTVYTAADADEDDSADVTVSVAGDFSVYTLRVVAADDQGRPTNQPYPGFDPRYDSVDFQFKAGCPSDLDCKPQSICPKPAPVEPEINYLAKDYASFRQLILDRLATIMPDWQEQHVPDIGVALVEVLAYTGDHLSYYQDAVATEAYLDTARTRISVRRHVRLVDYRLSEGCNARTWLCIYTNSDLGPIRPGDIYFITEFPNAPQDHWLLEEADIESVPPSSYRVFEPLVAERTKPLQFLAARSRIDFYTWGNRECCIPRGATSATLVDVPPPPPAQPSSTQPSAEPQPGTPPAPGAAAPPATPTPARAAAPSATTGGAGGRGEGSDLPPRRLNLHVGDYLIFEEVLGPRTGVPEDADPTHRHVVRLTKVDLLVDDLYDPPWLLVQVQWAPEDALSFPLCLSSVTDPSHGCTYIENVSVACGNVLLVDHGKTTDPEPVGCVPPGTKIETCECECHPGESSVVSAVFETKLKNGPLTFAQPLPSQTAASQLLSQDPHCALPEISLTGTRNALTGPITTTWTPQPDLLESTADEFDFVVEMDDAGDAHIRFGDGDCGRQPDSGTCFSAVYRAGNGPAGNVGADTIRYLIFRRNPIITDARICNPLAAQGGTAPETLAEAKLLAPHAFRDVPERAVTAADYATLADRNANLQQAACALRWTGGWYEALVTVDPKGTEDTQWKLDRAIARYLYPFRRMGHDLAVKPARYVPLDIEMVICVLPDYLRGHVEAALLDAFSNRVLPDGTLGFFHPDNLTFGQSIYLSQLVATAQRITGVESVTVTTFERLYEGPNGEISNGVLLLGPFEIARVDNDPSFPENGRIAFDMRGGR